MALAAGTWCSLAVRRTRPLMLGLVRRRRPVAGSLGVRRLPGHLTRAGSPRRGRRDR
jgi:hypothetical protein